MLLFVYFSIIFPPPVIVVISILVCSTCVSVCLPVLRAVPVPATAASSSFIYWEVIMQTQSNAEIRTLPLSWNPEGILILCLSFSAAQRALWAVRPERRQRGWRRRRSPWRPLDKATSKTFCTKSVAPREALQGQTQCSQCNNTQWQVYLNINHSFVSYILIVCLIVDLQSRGQGSRVSARDSQQEDGDLQVWPWWRQPWRDCPNHGE